MKEIQSLLKIMSDGLKTLAQGVEIIAEKVDEIAASEEKAKPSKRKPAKATAKAKAGKKPARKVAQKRGAKPMTAADRVLKIIGGSKKGVSAAAIMQKTGYDRKQLSNVIYRLSKQGKIKSIQKGVYVKA
jgi:hypothetical protein